MALFGTEREDAALARLRDESLQELESGLDESNNEPSENVDDLEPPVEQDEGDEWEDEDDDRDDLPLRLSQDAAGHLTVDLSGRHGTAGRDGRPGRDGRMGRVLKKGGLGAGGAGTAGTKGTNGGNGRDAKSASFELVAGKEITLRSRGRSQRLTSVFTIDASGGDGGRGGHGGRGGSGGVGSPWGRSGRDGAGGDGGNGGDGGDIEVATETPHLLAMIRDVLVAGGAGGPPGDGDSTGRGGMDGRAGTVTLAYVEPISEEREEDDHYGLTIEDAVVEDDGTRINGHFTRGSKFRITRVTAANQSAIRVPPPFSVAFSTQAPFELTDGGSAAQISNDKKMVAANDRVRLPGEVAFHVRPRCDIGRFTLRAAAITSLAGLTVHLNSDSEDSLFTFSVNHRIVPESIQCSDEERPFVAEWAPKLNALSPDDQLSSFCAILLITISPTQEIGPRAREHLDRMLEGQLFQARTFWKVYGDFWKTAGISDHADAAFLLAVDFFASLAEDTRAKVMDAAYYVAGSDGVLADAEKQQLKRLATGLRFDENWLRRHQPKLLEEGDSSARASNTNTLAFALYPVVVGAIYFGSVRLALTTSPRDNFVTDVIVSHGFLGELALYALVAAVLLPLFRALFVHRACASCGSIRLAAVELRKKARSLIGTADEFRCLDCAARGSTTANGDAALLHSDCGIATAPSEKPVAIAATIVVAVSGTVLAAAPPVFTGLQVLAWPTIVLTAGLAAMSIGLMRGVRRIGAATIIAVAAVAAVGVAVLASTAARTVPVHAPGTPATSANSQASAPAATQSSTGAKWPDGSNVTGYERVVVHQGGREAAGLWLVYPNRCETDIVMNQVAAGTEATLNGKPCLINGVWYARLAFSQKQMALNGITGDNTWLPLHEVTVRR